MPSSHLSTALKYWLDQGHSQKEFVEATGIDVGTASLLFRGLRGLTLKQRASVYFAFRDRPDLHDALGWLVADLRDNVPLELAEYIKVHLEAGARIREAHPLSPKEAAKARFIAALEADDPSTVELVMSLDAFSQAQATVKPKSKH